MLKLAALADGGDVHVAVQHLDILIGLDLPAQHFAGLLDPQARGAYAFAHHLEGNLFEVENDVGGVFHHARNRAELVLHAFDAHGGDRRALDGAQQHAAQTVADGGPKTALEWLRGKHAIAIGQSLRIGNQAFGFLKTFEHS